MNLCVNTLMLASMLVDLRMFAVGITHILVMVAGCQVLMYLHKVFIRKSKSHS